MRRSRVAGWLTTAGLVAIPCAIVAAAAPPADQESGRALFVTYCASCHGTGGRGDGPAAAGLRTPPADLTMFAARNGGRFPAERTRRIIDGREAGVRAHGNLEMPVWGDAFRRREGLSDAASRARVDAIVGYLESIQQRSGD